MAEKIEGIIYRHTSEMGEISGFGGMYEDSCQDMLQKGVEWMNDNLDADLQASGFKNIFGVIKLESDDAKQLSKVITDVSENCSGAMHQAVMSRLFFIAKNGWDKYVEKTTMRQEQKND